MALFRRHLGLPACAELDERLETLIDESRTWYERHGQPWTETKHVPIQRIVYDVIHLEGPQQLRSPLLARGLARVGAYALVVAAISSGEEVERRIDELWKADRVDEAMFLNAYAIAVVEHLRWEAGDRLRREHEPNHETVLPHYSPGYDGWDLADQARLYRLIRGNGGPSENRLQLLPSGGLVPSKSTLAAYGVTRRADLDEDLEQYWSCRTAPTSRRAEGGSYAFPEKALTGWCDKRLQVFAESNRSLKARFRFEGSTCTNMGVPWAFDYEVRLEQEAEGDHRIVSASCEPVTDHAGYRSMCAYITKPERFMSQLKSHQPMVGQLLSEVLGWQPSVSPAGCLCTRASQDHKWRIVLQTIHFALNKT